MHHYLEDIQPQHWPKPKLKLSEFQVLNTIRKENQILENIVHVY